MLSISKKTLYYIHYNIPYFILIICLCQLLINVKMLYIIKEDLHSGILVYTNIIYNFKYMKYIHYYLFF